MRIIFNLFEDIFTSKRVQDYSRLAVVIIGISLVFHLSVLIGHYRDLYEADTRAKTQSNKTVPTKIETGK